MFNPDIYCKFQWNVWTDRNCPLRVYFKHVLQTTRRNTARYFAASSSHLLKVIRTSYCWLSLVRFRREKYIPLSSWYLRVVAAHVRLVHTHSYKQYHWQVGTVNCLQWKDKLLNREWQKELNCWLGNEGNIRVRNFCERRTKGNAISEGIGNEELQHAHTCSHMKWFIISTLSVTTPVSCFASVTPHIRHESKSNAR